MNLNFGTWLAESRTRLTLYHGTHADFDRFSLDARTTTDYGHYGYGIYLTPLAGLARQYGPRVYKCEVTLDNPYVSTGTREEFYDRFGVDYGLARDRSAAKELTRRITEAGYDGVIVHGWAPNPPGPISEVCVFDPDKIKIVDKA